MQNKKVLCWVDCWVARNWVWLPFLKATSFNSTGNETKLKRRKKVKFYVKRQRIWQNQAYMSPRDFLFEKEEKIAYKAEKRTMGVQNTD